MYTEWVNPLSKKEVTKWAVTAILAASLIATFFYLAPGISSTTGLNSSVTNARSAGLPITFGFVGSNYTQWVTAAAGSTVHGTIILSILQVAPLRFYIDDIGYNTSSTLPAGISISLNIYGNTYDPPLLSSNYSQPPLVSTALGETNVQYAISVANSVPSGVYYIGILCWSFQKNGTVYDQGAVYEVILNVQ
jgi:hypothetical protein